ncbi:MAG: hypothetical protein AB8V23_00460 [Candidatus Midichloria sp.]|nr:hypothetical protein MHYMCMPSP_00206 [Hyalomma marginatum]
MLDLIKTTKSIIQSKFGLFLSVYTQVGLLLLVTALFSPINPSLFNKNYITNEIPNIDELPFSQFFLLMFLTFLNFAYISTSNIYVTIINKESYKPSKQLYFVFKNIFKIILLRLNIFLISIAVCGFIFTLIKLLSSSSILALISISFIMLLYLTPILLIADVELLLNKSSVIQSINKSFLFVKENLAKCMKISTMVAILYMSLAFLQNSIVYIVLCCLANTFVSVLFTVFYIQNKNNSINDEI